eukprot:5277434-Alexandrium_andersonii.AAC.1
MASVRVSRGPGHVADDVPRPCAWRRVQHPGACVRLHMCFVGHAVAIVCARASMRACTSRRAHA